MDADQNVIVLDTGARIADATGTTSADRIGLDQRTGDFTRRGQRQLQPPARKGPEEELRNALRRRPFQATARKMDSRNRNRQIHYEGDVVMWQGANRIQADVVDLDRDG